VRRDSWQAYFTGGDGQGLADRTQRRFFSDGTIPEDSLVDHDTTALDVVTAARQSLTYALPTVPRLDLREIGRVRYVTAPDGAGGKPRALLAYERLPGRVRFFLDGRVYADSARVLLPEIAGYAAGLVDHLFRTRIKLSLAEGRATVTVVPSGRGAEPRPVGRIVILAEDAQGHRREIGASSSSQGGPNAPGVSWPAGSRKLVAFLRAEDAAGPVVAFTELTVPAAPVATAQP
jgi:hypothetical protein